MLPMKTDIKDEFIIKFLWNAYGLDVEKILLLPMGADFNTFVYRVTTVSKTDYFLKLRSSDFFDASVLVPKYLAAVGVKQVILPLVSKTGQLWMHIASFTVILYPWVEGRNGMEAKLSDQQWIEFGKTIKNFHNAKLPATVTSSVKHETFSPKWREKLNAFLGRIEEESFKEPVAAEMATFLKSKNAEILNLIKRAQELALILLKQPLEYILCHADLHGWNLLIDQAGALFIVDWDTLIFAPKERDLMFIGVGRIGDSGRAPLEEAELFYQGYGQTKINQHAISYYCFERIIQDICEYCEQIFLLNQDKDCLLQSFEYLKSNFLPGGTIERAWLLSEMIPK